MQEASIQALSGDPKLIDPDISGLDDTFDKVISDIPQSLIQAPDDWALDPALSADPMTILYEIRDRCGYVVQGENGVFGGVPLSNNFACRLLKISFAESSMSSAVIDLFSENENQKIEAMD